MAKKPRLNHSVALKLHAFGLNQLHDPNWTGMDLFDHVKQHTQGRVEPADLLHRTLPDGLLPHIGEWLYHDYLISDTHRMSLASEYRLWYLEDVLALLKSAGVSASTKEIRNAASLVRHINSLYSKNEEEYWNRLEADTIFAVTDDLITNQEQHIKAVTELYAQNYAERVFHDRQLCEHISRTLVAIGFDGTTDSNSVPIQWVARQSSWPTWAVNAVIARDRGACALCGVNITSELRAEKHIDHIVALASGGTNDLCNLQLLCDRCNRKKSAKAVKVLSSVPEYLQFALEHRRLRKR